MAITITITDPQDHAPYELRALAEYFQALANDKTAALKRIIPDSVRTTHDEELLSDEERAALRDTIAEAGLEDSANEAIAGTSAAIRASAGGDQEPYALNAGGSDDFSELRDDPKPDASTGAAASDGKTAQAASTPSLDSAGMPWDERIHSGSKSVNADGTWRYKRGGDLAERERIEAELRGKPDGASATPAAQAPAITDAAMSSTSSDQRDALPAAVTDGSDDEIPPPPVEDDVPPPPADEDDVPPPPVEPVVEEVNSGMVFRAITAGQKGSLTQEAIVASLQAVGLTSTIDILKADQSVLVPLLALIEEASK